MRILRFFLERLAVGTESSELFLHFEVVPDHLPERLRETSSLDRETIERFIRLARYWDRIANSGRFKVAMPLLLENGEGGSPFYNFLAFSDWLWKRTGKTCRLSPESLTDALFDYLVERGLPRRQVEDALLADYLASGARGSPATLKARLPKLEIRERNRQKLASRQAAHGVSGPDR